MKRLDIKIPESGEPWTRQHCFEMACRMSAETKSRSGNSDTEKAIEFWKNKMVDGVYFVGKHLSKEEIDFIDLTEVGCQSDQVYLDTREIPDSVKE